MKRGFTLIELIVVVIVIGILATLAAPQYLKAVERTKGGKARHALGLLASAEKMYRADNNIYINCNPGACDAALGQYVELADIDAESAAATGDWNCDVTGADENGFTANCARKTGPYQTWIIHLDQTGTWAVAANPF